MNKKQIITFGIFFLIFSLVIPTLIEASITKNLKSKETITDECGNETIKFQDVNEPACDVYEYGGTGCRYYYKNKCMTASDIKNQDWEPLSYQIINAPGSDGDDYTGLGARLVQMANTKISDGGLEIANSVPFSTINENGCNAQNKYGANFSIYSYTPCADPDNVVHCPHPSTLEKEACNDRKYISQTITAAILKFKEIYRGLNSYDWNEPCSLANYLEGGEENVWPYLEYTLDAVTGSVIASGNNDYRNMYIPWYGGSTDKYIDPWFGLVDDLDTSDANEVEELFAKVPGSYSLLYGDIASGDVIAHTSVIPKTDMAFSSHICTYGIRDNTTGDVFRILKYVETKPSASKTPNTPDLFYCPNADFNKRENKTPNQQKYFVKKILKSKLQKSDCEITNVPDTDKDSTWIYLREASDVDEIFTTGNKTFLKKIYLVGDKNNQYKIFETHIKNTRNVPANPLNHTIEIEITSKDKDNPVTVISDGTITFDYPAVYVSNFIFSNLNFKDTDKLIIDNDANRITFKNNKFTNTKGTILRPKKNWVIKDNAFSGSGNAIAIEAWTIDGQEYYPNKNIVINNVFNGPTVLVGKNIYNDTKVLQNEFVGPYLVVSNDMIPTWSEFSIKSPIAEDGYPVNIPGLSISNLASARDTVGPTGTPRWCWGDAKYDNYYMTYSRIKDSKETSCMLWQGYNDKGMVGLEYLDSDCPCMENPNANKQVLIGERIYQYIGTEGNGQQYFNVYDENTRSRIRCFDVITNEDTSFNVGEGCKRIKAQDVLTELTTGAPDGIIKTANLKIEWIYNVKYGASSMRPPPIFKLAEYDTSYGNDEWKDNAKGCARSSSCYKLIFDKHDYTEQVGMVELYKGGIQPLVLCNDNIQPEITTTEKTIKCDGYVLSFPNLKKTISGSEETFNALIIEVPYTAFGRLGLNAHLSDKGALNKSWSDWWNEQAANSDWAKCLAESDKARTDCSHDGETWEACVKKHPDDRTCKDAKFDAWSRFSNQCNISNSEFIANNGVCPDDKKAPPSSASESDQIPDLTAVFHNLAISPVGIVNNVMERNMTVVTPGKEKDKAHQNRLEAEIAECEKAHKVWNQITCQNRCEPRYWMNSETNECEKSLEGTCSEDKTYNKKTNKCDLHCNINKVPNGDNSACVDKIKCGNFAKWKTGNACICDTSIPGLTLNSDNITCGCSDGKPPQSAGVTGGFTCNRPIAPVTPSGCKTDSDCSSDQTCNNGSCVLREKETPKTEDGLYGSKCESNSNCKTNSGLYCGEEGRCICNYDSGYVADNSNLTTTGITTCKYTPTSEQTACVQKGGTYCKSECIFEKEEADCCVGGKFWNDGKCEETAPAISAPKVATSSCSVGGSGTLPQNLTSILPYLMLLAALKGFKLGNHVTKSK